MHENPVTLSVDAQGNVIDQSVADLSESELAEKTEAAIKKVNHLGGHVKRFISVLLLGLCLTACSEQTGKAPPIQTHSSTAPGAIVTMVHFGANW